MLNRKLILMCEKNFMLKRKKERKYKKMGIHRNVKLVKKEQLKDDIFKFSVESEEMCKLAKPGQFLEIKVCNGIEPILRRPISIYNIDEKNNLVEFIFQVKGKGTKILSEVEEGKEIDIIGPVGNGVFDIKKYKNVAIIGGGIGIFPLYELAKRLKECSYYEDKTNNIDKINNTHIEEKQSEININTYLGFRNKELVTLENEFEKVSTNLIITTDDGSYKEKGFAIDKLREDIEKSANIENLENSETQIPDMIFACGPLPMLKAVQKLSLEKNIPCQISLEEKMACGLGVCLGCAVKVVNGDNDAGTVGVAETVSLSNTQQLEYKHVCKDGPVFWANEVEL